MVGRCGHTNGIAFPPPFFLVIGSPFLVKALCHSRGSSSRCTQVAMACGLWMAGRAMRSLKATFVFLGTLVYVDRHQYPYPKSTKHTQAFIYTHTHTQHHSTLPIASCLFPSSWRRLSTAYESPKQNSLQVIAHFLSAKEHRDQGPSAPPDEIGGKNSPT